MFDFFPTAAVVGIVGLFLFVAVLLLARFISRLYKRTTQDSAFVRTGFGGAKVIVEGGAMIFPVLHEISIVSLKTHKLDVARKAAEALITKDSLRADVTVEFFVRVEKSIESIKIAAQTLGPLTNNPSELKRLVEGKFVDALRSVAATMDLNELHQNRSDFVQKVRQAANEDLMKNGLELESASLVGLDQTDQQFFNPSNTFDAAGLAKIAQITETKKRERFDIEMSTQVAIAERQRDATKQTLDIERDTALARIQQGRELAESEATTAATIAEKQNNARSSTEQSRIKTDREIAEREIEKNQSIQIAEQKRTISVAEQSKLQSAAEAEAATAKAAAVKAEQSIETVTAVAVAERRKEVELVDAKLAAERSAIGLTVGAQAEKDAALLRADAIKSVATAESEAEQIRADGKAKTYQVEAEGKRALNEAQNTLSETVIDMQIRMRVVEILPQIIEASVKPLDNIDSIKIVDVGGLNGGGAGAAAGEGATTANASFSDQVVNSALRHRTLAPLVDGILKQVGIAGGGSLEALTAGLVPAVDGKTSTEVVELPAADAAAATLQPAAGPAKPARVSRDTRPARPQVTDQP
jgi:uncharacterized membrane protein YqiK